VQLNEKQLDALIALLEGALSILKGSKKLMGVLSGQTKKTEKPP